jgi:hypothetical protein
MAVIAQSLPATGGKQAKAAAKRQSVQAESNQRLGPKEAGCGFDRHICPENPCLPAKFETRVAT